MDCDLASEQDSQRGPAQDPQVHPDRTLRGVHLVDADFLGQDVVHVMPEPVAGIEDGALACEGELAEAGDAGLDAMDDGELGRMKLDEAGVLWSRADEAHLPSEDIPELRELVELRPREERPEPREALVVR